MLELMISLLLTSFLLVALCSFYISLQRQFRLFQTLSAMQEDAYHLVNWLRTQIHEAGDFSCEQSAQGSAVFQAVPKNALPASLQAQLHSLSDVLILRGCKYFSGKRQLIETAYYVSTTDENGGNQKAFFEKPLHSSRKEITANVVDFALRLGANEQNLNTTAIQPVNGIAYALVFQSDDIMLSKASFYRVYEKLVYPLDQYLYRVWYGFAALSYV